MTATLIRNREGALGLTAFSSREASQSGEGLTIFLHFYFFSFDLKIRLDITQDIPLYSTVPVSLHVDLEGAMLPLHRPMDKLWS